MGNGRSGSGASSKAAKAQQRKPKEPGHPNNPSGEPGSSREKVTRFHPKHGAKAEKWLAKEYAAALDSATLAQRRALSLYQSDYYLDWNKALRKRSTRGIEASHRPNIVAMRNLIAQSPRLKRAAIVYRGLDTTRMKLPNSTWEKGTIIRDRGFMSTSLDRMVAYGKFSQGDTVLRIRLPKGTRGFAPAALGFESAFNEREIILRPGSKIRVDKSRMTKRGTRVVFATLIKD